MADAYFDVVKNTSIDALDVTAATGGTLTNDVAVTWDTTLTREEVINTLRNIIGAFENTTKVTEVA